MMTMNRYQKSALILTRIFIGWHFLYEGIIKAYNPYWTSKGYLLSSTGFMKGFFQWLASDSLVGIVDNLNIIFLMIVGITLLLGFAEKIGYISGIGLLLLYYLSHPAFPGLEQGVTEGNYWLINKNLIEAAALFVLLQFPKSHIFGLNVFFSKNLKEVKNEK